MYLRSSLVSSAATMPFSGSCWLDSQFASQGRTVSVNPTGVPRNLLITSPALPCSLPHPDRSALWTFQQLGPANGILPPEGVSKEADLLKCFQTYMSLFQSHGKEMHSDSQTYQSPTWSQQAFLATNEDKNTREQIGRSTSKGKDLNIHIHDAEILKDAPKAKNARKVRTIKHVLGELKALGAEQGGRVLSYCHVVLY